MHLPDMTGLDVLGAIREEHGDIIWPVVVLTGSIGVGEPASVLRAGAQDFISKEWITPDSLARALANATERHRLIQDLRHAEERLRLALAAGEHGHLGMGLDNQPGDLVGRPLSASSATRTRASSRPMRTGQLRVHPEDLPRCRGGFKDSLARATPNIAAAYRVVWPDGRFIGSKPGVVICCGVGRAAERMHGIMIDVTESKLTN